MSRVVVNTRRSHGRNNRLMTGSSKILTVSYGTFSCTLEGFDDPFSTMRTIAEYFRDLAAEDRYFGAEPPTPDPEMLQSLAEREAARRVEAHVADGGIALRQVATTSAAVTAPAKDITDTPSAFEADEPENAFSDLGADQDETPSETIAEKLKRIRAVVSRSRDAQPFPGEDRENQPTSPQLFEGDDALHAPAPTVSDTSEPVEDEHDDDGATEQSLRDAALSATIASLSSAEAEDEEPAEAEEEITPALEAQLREAARAEDAEDDEDELHAVPDSDEIDRILALTKTRDEEKDVAVTDATATTEEGTAESPSDAVIREEVEDDDLQEEVAEAPAYAGPEAVLSLVETEEAAEIDDEGPGGDDLQLPSSRNQTRVLREAGEPEVARLMAQAEQRFEDDEGQRRRRVISQLRAAVVAAKADRAMQDRDGRQADSDDGSSRYRDDLSRAMPRTPSREASHDEAPLMLGSDQRVDAPDSAEARSEADVVPEVPEEDIHPRRVSRDPDAPQQQDAASFAEFAEHMGAQDLSDLLEAAAAYTSFVEGQTSFSRPQIMKRVARINPSVELSREAGLRSFGQLLRQGKIQKLQRGQFTISKTTRFNPGHRIAGE